MVLKAVCRHGRQQICERRNRCLAAYCCAPALWQHDTDSYNSPRQLVDLHDPDSHELLAHPVQCQHRLLICLLTATEPHAGPLSGFPDRCGIRGIVLVRFDERTGTN